MSRGPLAALAVALSVVAAVALPIAGPASAAGTCTLTPPARIAVYQENLKLSANIAGDCGGAYWYTEQKNRYASAVLDPTNGVDTPTIFVPDLLDYYGRVAWQPYGAVVDPSCTDNDGATLHASSGLAEARERAKHVKGMPSVSPSAASRQRSALACEHVGQNQPYSDIRLGGYASLSASRSGSKITFLAGSGGWSPYSHKLAARPHVGGEIQTQFADGTWHRVGNPFRTTSNAKAQVTFTIPATRTFRFAIYSTASYFERASNPITR